MYVTIAIEGGGGTANMAACLFKLGYLLLVVPDTKSLLDERGSFEENMKNRGITP